MKAKKSFFLFAFGVLIFTAQTINAQVTIGSELEPASGTLLDLKENADGSATKGFKLPRVALISLSDLAPCVTNATNDEKDYYKGLQVYNTNSKVGEGVLTWDGSKWSSFAMETQIIQGSLLVDGVIKSATGYTNFKFAELTIEQAGVYLIEAACYCTSSASSYGHFRMYDANLSTHYWLESDYIGQGMNPVAWRRIRRSAAVRLAPGKYYTTITGTSDTEMSISSSGGYFNATLLNY